METDINVLCHTCIKQQYLLFPNIAQLFHSNVYLEENCNFNCLKIFNVKTVIYLGYSQRFLASIIIRAASSSLCSLESFCFARKETHRDDIKDTLFTYPLPYNLNRESFSRSVGEPSHFRSPDLFALRPNDM